MPYLEMYEVQENCTFTRVEITEEQAEVIGEVLGFDEETAKEDVEIIEV